MRTLETQVCVLVLWKIFILQTITITAYAIVPSTQNEPFFCFLIDNIAIFSVETKQENKESVKYCLTHVLEEDFRAETLVL